MCRAAGRAGCLGDVSIQLLDHAFGGLNVIAPAEIDRLIDAAAFLEAIEILHITDLADLRDVLVRRHGDVAGVDQLFTMIEVERDAAFGVVACGGL